MPLHLSWHQSWIRGRQASPLLVTSCNFVWGHACSLTHGSCVACRWGRHGRLSALCRVARQCAADREGLPMKSEIPKTSVRHSASFSASCSSCVSSFSCMYVCSVVSSYGNGEYAIRNSHGHAPHTAQYSTHPATPHGHSLTLSHSHSHTDDKFHESGTLAAACLRAAFCASVPLFCRLGRGPDLGC